MGNDPVKVGGDEREESFAGELAEALVTAARAVETALAGGRDLPVGPLMTAEEARTRIAAELNLDTPLGLDELAERVATLLRDGLVHVTHPRYFGLFNPSVLPAAVAADALTAAFNPQAAAVARAPAGVEIEQYVLRYLASRIGFDPEATAATFTTGGSEANHSAVLAALADRFPSFAEDGLCGLAGRPRLYLSSESHGSFPKIAQMVGLGRDSAAVVAADGEHRLAPSAVREAVRQDREAGSTPFMLVATAGTTATGAIDPLPELAEVAASERLWFHVDAAWGGTAALSRRLRPLLSGIERADSVTWDAHKWLSVPMAAGMFFCRHRSAVLRAFSSGPTNYMLDAGVGGADPFQATMQWSRRLTGLKLLMALASLGRDGAEEMVDRMAALGDRLRERLTIAGWRVVNHTPLPLVCFTHARIENDREATFAVASRVQAVGRAWLSAVLLSGETPALRACITSFRTTENDLDVLLEELDRALGG